MNAEHLWSLIERTSSVLGILLAIPILWTWWQVTLGVRHQRRRWLAEILRKPGARPGVLIINLLPGKDIYAQVRTFLAHTEALAPIPEERILHLNHPGPLESDEIIDFMHHMRQLHRTLMDAGVDVIHLFFAGPAVAAMMVGAELGNGARVMLYHYDQGQYSAFGPLEPLRLPG